MHRQRKPAGRTEAEAQARSHSRSAPVETGFDREPAVVRPVRGKACWEGLSETGLIVLEDEGDLLARHGLIEAADFGDDESTDDHDDAEGDDRAGVEPGPEHPCAVLVDLEAFDVDVGQDCADGGQDCKETDVDLRFEFAAKAMTRNHEGADVGDEEEQDDDIAVDTMENEGMVTDPGDKLGVTLSTSNIRVVGEHGPPGRPTRSLVE